VIRDPVVLLGPPRSGTTLLFETLARHAGLWSIGRESHAVLEGPFHPRLRGWESNALGAGDLDPATAERLRGGFERRALPGTFWRSAPPAPEGPDRRDALRRREHRAAIHRAWQALRRAVGRPPVRLLEKTPKNCLRVPFLAALFPDARFVVLRRDGRATVSSLMDGWRAAGTYRTYETPVPLSIAGYAGRAWCFTLPPGWRRLVERPLEEVCAEQWAASAEALQAAVPGLGAAGRVHETSYEDLVARPREVLAGVLRFLGLPFEEALLPEGDRLRVINAVTPPAPDKWRARNGPAVERILPRIAAAQAGWGYPSGG